MTTPNDTTCSQCGGTNDDPTNGTTCGPCDWRDQQRSDSNDTPWHSRDDWRNWGR